jgi:hypothetical protein
MFLTWMIQAYFRWQAAVSGVFGELVHVPFVCEFIDLLVRWACFGLVFVSRADDSTLQDYNVSAGDTIHMVLQLRGGSL